MSDNNRQSINNYVYSRRREPANDNPAPPPQNNSFDFTDRNASSQSNSSYNSYVSSYQPANTIQQNNYNNSYSGYQPNDYNSSYQNYPPQNTYQDSYSGYQPSDTYSNYNDNHFQEPHHAVEVPLPSVRIKMSTLIVLIGFFAPTGFSVFLPMILSAFPVNSSAVSFLTMAPVILMFAGLIGGVIIGPVIDRINLKKVCTVPVTRHLVGYLEERRHTKHHHYYVYAPQYEIFINNHYEIRTLDDFTRHSDSPVLVDLLVNPSGYQIMPADNSLSRSGRESISGAIVLAVIMLAFFLMIFLPMFFR